MLDKKLKAKWVRALRSGKYKQGTGSLRIDGETRKDEQFCCLGVLCEIAGTRRRASGGYWIGKVSAKDYLAGPLFKQVGSDNQDKLALMNDGNTGITKPKSFKVIATWIERNL